CCYATSIAQCSAPSLHVALPILWRLLISIVPHTARLSTLSSVDTRNMVPAVLFTAWNTERPLNASANRSVLCSGSTQLPPSTPSDLKSTRLNSSHVKNSYAVFF